MATWSCSPSSAARRSWHTTTGCCWVRSPPAWTSCKSAPSELRISRQRLVAAQDEERRRIERDLHDGAQHELITLAGQLRQLARGPRRARAAPSTRWRTRPSRRSSACRTWPAASTRACSPTTVSPRRSGRTSVECRSTSSSRSPPRRPGRRWATELEVALYFVAVEALGNIRKHAKATTTTVTLAERDHR